MSSNRKIKLIGNAPTDPIVLKESTLIPLNLSSIQYLDEKSLKYKTIEDFVERREAYKKFVEFSKDLKDWLNSCDNQLKNEHFSTFLSNGHWFAHRLNDLLYFQLFIQKLEDRFDEIEIFVSEPPSFPKPKVSNNDYNFRNFGFGERKFFNFLALGLKKKRVIVSSRKSKNYSKIEKKFNSPLNQLLPRIPEIIYRRFSNLIREKINKFLINGKTQVFWIAQDGYEVAQLKLKSSILNFSPAPPPSPQKQQKISGKDIQYIKECSKSFFYKWLPSYTEWLTEWILSFTENLAVNAPNIYQLYCDEIRRQSPKGVLFSLGAGTLPETLLATACNKLNIPVFYFKHGGVDDIFQEGSLLDPYFEKNETIARTHFLHSPLELSEYSKIKNVKPVVTGPIERVKYSRQKYKEKPLKLIYSMGPPATWSYKDIHKCTTDQERHTLSTSLIQYCKNNDNIKLDIKVHPAEWETTYAYLENLLVQHRVKNIRLICGGSIDRILGNYDCIIFDIYATRVLSGALHTDIDIVVYSPETMSKNFNNLAILKKRAHIIENPKELYDFLKGYGEQNQTLIPTKTTESHINNNLPVHRIVEKIEQNLLGKNL